MQPLFQQSTAAKAHVGFWESLANLCLRQWPRYLLLAAIGFAVRLPALQGGFIWDDAYLARDNPFIKSPVLVLEAFRHYLFLDSFSGHYRPVQNISYMFDYYFWNTDSCGFHLTNILLHVGSGLLLFRLLTILFRPGNGLWPTAPTAGKINHSLAAFLVALLWVVHPVHSAAVDYISGRADSLAFLLACSAWLIVFSGRQARSRWLKTLSYAGATLLGVLSICSREIGVIWIVLFLVHTFAFAVNLPRHSKIAAVVCCALVIGACLELRHLPERRTGTGISENFSVPVRATLALRSLGDYGRLMVFPGNLHMERSVIAPANFLSHESWRKSATSEYLSVLGLCVGGILLYGSWRKGEGRSLRVLGAAWFFAAYLPISNIIQLNATAAEHWLYLPSVGFLIFLLGCAVEMPARFHRSIVGFAAIAVVALGVRSSVRSSDWRDEETFYKRTLAAGGASCRVAVNLAQIYSKRGDFATAEKMFRHIIETNPDYSSARNNLAELFSREGRTSEAEKLFKASAKAAANGERNEYPRSWIAALNVAHMRHHAHDDQDAVAVLEKARLDFPEAWELIKLDAELQRRTKGPDAALHLIEDFARKNWWHHEAALAEGKLYAQNNEPDRAIAALRRAAMLDVHDVDALNLLAILCVRENHLDQACAAQRRAVARQPDKPSQYILLSDILEKMGRNQEAHSILAQVNQMQALAKAQPATLAN